jgi:hypothetical protein
MILVVSTNKMHTVRFVEARGRQPTWWLRFTWVRYDLIGRSRTWMA